MNYMEVSGYVKRTYLVRGATAARCFICDFSLKYTPRVPPSPAESVHFVIIYASLNDKYESLISICRSSDPLMIH